MADPVLQSPTNPHFFQPLLPGFDSHLNIPVKFFSSYIEGRNEGRQTVKLRSDASEKSWKVKMESRRLTVGWKEFASAHDFRIGDVIIFRQEGALVFHVTSFGPSFCEIQYVQSCNNDLGDDQDKINSGKSSMKQSLKRELDDDDKDKNMGKRSSNKHVKKRIPEAEAKSLSSDESCFVANVTDSNMRNDTLFLPRKFVRPDVLNGGSNKIVLMNERARTWTLILKFRKSSRTFYMRASWRSFCHENGLKSGDSVTFKLEINNAKTPLLHFSTAESNSVFTKESSKGETSQRVSSSPSENRFLIVTITPSSLRGGKLHLPLSFTRVNKMEKEGGKKITLSDKHGVEWPVSLMMEKGSTRMRLASGLKGFLIAIGVKEYESIVLELVWEEKTALPMLKFCSKTKA